MAKRGDFNVFHAYYRNRRKECIVNRGERWFGCSLLEARHDELIGPFPSQEEAEKDARATLGIEEAVS
jgi:hypothetical protein